MELNSKTIKKIIFIIFCGALIFAATQNLSGVFGAVRTVVSFFSPVIAAFCIAFVLNVLLNALENKVFVFLDKSKKKFIRKLKRPVCIVLTYLLAIGIVSLLVWVIIPGIIETLTYLAERLPSFVVQSRDWAQGILHKFNLAENGLPEIKIDWSAIAKSITDWLSGYSGKLVDGAVGITTSVFAGVFDAVFSIVISIYILAQKERIGAFAKRFINAFIPEKATKVIYHIAFRTYDSFSRFIGGQLVESLILGTLCFIGMLIFGMPNALVISVLICVTSLVPVVGATVGVIIGFLLIVISNPIKALFFVLFVIILQQIEGNLIYPKVVGKAVGLPGVIVVSAVLVGGNIGGVLGALLAVPTSAVIFILLKEAIEIRNKKIEG